MVFSFLAKRQSFGTAEVACPKRSERGTLSAVATTVLFDFLDLLDRERIYGLILGFSLYLLMTTNISDCELSNT